MKEGWLEGEGSGLLASISPSPSFPLDPIRSTSQDIVFSSESFLVSLLRTLWLVLSFELELVKKSLVEETSF